MKKMLITIGLLAILGACSDTSDVPNSAATKTAEKSKDAMMQEFGKALAVAVHDSPELRTLLKSKAMEMFDKDNDVLFATIADEKIGSSTVREFIAGRCQSAATLDEIEKNIPLLNILVPTLPEESFSAEGWNVDLQIPKIAVTQHANDKGIPLYTNEGLETNIANDLIPGFPVLVINENERVRTVQGSVRGHASGRTFSAGRSSFVFVSDNFDGSIKTKSNAREFVTVDQKLIDAYNIYNGTDGWHRDYIYYNITPNEIRGPFSYQFQEHFTSFQLEDDPMGMYNRLANAPEDPKFKNVVLNTGTRPWTEGRYEFLATVLYNARNGVGENFPIYFSASPEDLFRTSFTRVGFYYTVKITGFRRMDFEYPIFNWDLNNYATTIRIDLEEVDAPSTNTMTVQTQATYAGNFETFGEGGQQGIWKIGLKFGGSATTVTTNTFQRQWTEANDPLGSVLVNFADNVVLHPYIKDGQIRSWNVRQYNAPYFSITVEPRRVQ